MLAEVIVAAGILVTILLGLAQIVLLTMSTNAAAKATTLASAFADQRVQQLRALPWTVVAGMRGGIDHLDDRGGVIISRAPPVDGEVPAGTAYVRRWTIAPLAAHPGDSLVVQVVVARVDSRRRHGEGGRPPATARVIGVRTRHGE